MVQKNIFGKPDLENLVNKIIFNYISKGSPFALTDSPETYITNGYAGNVNIYPIIRKIVNGKVADERCGLAGISLNKNSIPYDPEAPSVTSGIRVGSPATTTQGMGVNEMKTIANLIARAVKNEDESKFAGIKAEVHALTAQFPIYEA